MAKTKTKTKPLTRKQAEVKINKLLRGVDNSVAQVEKHNKSIQDSVPAVRELLIGLTNEPTIDATTKKDKTKVPKAAAKPKAAKPKAAASEKSATKGGNVKPPIDGRPALKLAIQEVFNGSDEPMAASSIWKIVTDKYGYWSRQSLYNALKDIKLFKKIDDKFSLISREDDSLDNFVDSVEKDQTTAEVV